MKTKNVTAALLTALMMVGNGELKRFQYGNIPDNALRADKAKVGDYVHLKSDEDAYIKTPHTQNNNRTGMMELEEPEFSDSIGRWHEVLGEKTRANAYTRYGLKPEDVKNIGGFFKFSTTSFALAVPKPTGRSRIVKYGDWWFSGNGYTRMIHEYIILVPKKRVDRVWKAADKRQANKSTYGPNPKWHFVSKVVRMDERVNFYDKHTIGMNRSDYHKMRVSPDTPNSYVHNGVTYVDVRIVEDITRTYVLHSDTCYIGTEDRTAKNMLANVHNIDDNLDKVIEVTKLPVSMEALRYNNVGYTELDSYNPKHNKATAALQRERELLRAPLYAERYPWRVKKPAPIVESKPLTEAEAKKAAFKLKMQEIRARKGK